ncbi:MAG TPA: hypothetical protein VN223_05535, partial [Candidatus Elarobacter sp.]|nr:hypothetical protein [Candidatus Elarobacter sp.]
FTTKHCASAIVLSAMEKAVSFMSHTTDSSKDIGPALEGDKRTVLNPSRFPWLVEARILVAIC